MVALIWIPPALIRSYVFFVHGVGGQGWVVLLAAACGLALPWLLRATGSLIVFGNVLALVWFMTLTSLCLVRGGFNAPALAGLGVVPLGATFVAGSRSGVLWCAAVVAEIVCLFALDRAGLKLPDRVPVEHRAVVQGVGAALLAVVLTWFAVLYERTTSAVIEALHRTERTSRTLLDAIPDVGLRMSRAGVTLAVHGREQLANAPAWSAGAPIDSVAPELSRALLEAIARSLASGEIVSVELETTVAGERRQYEARLAPSGPDEVFVLMRDLTDALALARRLALAEEETKLLRADRMASVGQLAAAVAHEANNPLAYVIANLSFVQARLAELRSAEVEAIRPALEEALVESQQGAHRVRQIVRDLKTFARADGGEQSPVSVPRVMDSTLKMAATEIRHRARLRKQYGDVPLIVANEGRIAQVFLNVLVNAAQAVEPGRADSHEIRVLLDRDAAGNVLVEVSDTGAGIAPEHLSRVTEPFFTTKPIGVGTGLGLTVCKNIVESHGGRLELTSRVGVGTTVRIVFPAAPGAMNEPARFEEAAPASHPTRCRILAIDDDPLVLRALRRVLREHELTTAQGGAEALELIASEPPFHVILCDVMMPDLTGMDVYERIAALGRGLERRMVFMTGGAFTEQARAFLAATPNPRLDKPFTPEALAQMIQRARESGDSSPTT